MYRLWDELSVLRALFSSLAAVRMAVGLLPFLSVLRKWRGVTVREFATRFQDPLFREAWGLAEAPLPIAAWLLTLTWLDRKAAGYPVGGYLEFSRSLASRYLGLGGDFSTVSG